MPVTKPDCGGTGYKSPVLSGLNYFWTQNLPEPLNKGGMNRIENLFKFKTIHCKLGDALFGAKITMTLAHNY